MPKKGSYTDITGEIYGKLKAIKYMYTKNRKPYWLCKCECGNTKIVSYNHLKNRTTKSCGCLKTRSIHNKSHSRIYRIWIQMKSRCYCEGTTHFHRYGGRGIKVCDEWKKEFKTFYNWAMNNGYKDDLTLDRIDNDKNYSPNNCRWVTHKQQMLNTSQNNFVTIDGERKTLSQWAEQYSLNYSTIQNRYRKGDRGLRLIRKTESKYNGHKKKCEVG